MRTLVKKSTDTNQALESGNRTFFLKRITWQIILLIIISVSLAGIFYYYRTTLLALSPLEDNLFRAVRMTCVYVLLPFGWAILIKKQRLTDLGISRNRLLVSIVLGLCIYSIALLAFLLSLGNPEFDRQFRWGAEYSMTNWLLIMALVSWMAFVTDLWTRGFVLMLLTKYESPLFGILIQNITWLAIHLYEVALLTPAMGFTGALALTVTLGLLGDIAVLKTKNIIGLGVGHIFLNIAFFGYIRFFG